MAGGLPQYMVKAMMDGITAYRMYGRNSESGREIYLEYAFMITPEGALRTNADLSAFWAIISSNSS